MLDLHHLETFCALAITRNFNQAAAFLGYSQPTVTTHIKLLERELGSALFVRWRFSRSVDLTDVGKDVLKYARQLLDLAAEAKSAAKASSPCSTPALSGTNEMVEDKVVESQMVESLVVESLVVESQVVER